MNIVKPARPPRRWRAAVTVPILAAGLGGLAGPPRAALASDPMGVYSLVGDVQYEPDKLNPERIRIHGVHALSYRPQEGPRRNWGIYTDPAPGYLYFACPSGRLDVCQMQWQDLEKAAGGARCAAFGSRYDTDPEPNGRLRARGEPPADPDPYPIGQGVTMVDRGTDDVCQKLRQAAADLGTPIAAPTEAPPTDPPPTKAVPTEPAVAAPDRFLPQVRGDASRPAAQRDDGTADAVGAATDTAADGGAPGRAVPPWLALAAMLGVGAAAIGAALVLSRGHRP